MNLFRNFPNVDYRIGDLTFNTTDLTRFAVIDTAALDEITSLVNYTIPDGERPDQTSYMLYNDVQFTWTILFVNQIRDIWTGWPLSQNDLTDYIENKYGSIAQAQTALHHHETPEGVRVFSPSFGSRAITNYDYEFELNESKRNIRVITPQYINQATQELRELFR